MVNAPALRADAQRFAGSIPATPTKLIMKIYGPYLRKDGRKHLVLVNGEITTSVSYPKWLLEKKLGRKLLPNETADHVDNDFRNDEISNLELLTRAENARKEMRRPERAKKYFEFTCPVCGKLAKKELRYVSGNWAKGRKGPFCSRQCAGKYNACTKRTDEACSHAI